ncbi:phenylacetate--CoA ligase family protein [Ichthyenterobacterium sp. W332]|uniref:Phenylacetate--CoA ligase family protein n=1 Tax=Microcosmobacter mediterraneus TaxID=3075607 RepID=A0ABU2YJ56_9FLAO|nr:phenylacetate--CoA ligase family protein [Ichthyenterobacterium sp. W332]MDT0558072.1 phenylacetate--CoA ligase family protein [Ichthyenterobacterium sp. W332]
MRFFDLSLTINGYPLEDAKRMLKNINALSIDEYSEYIESKREEIVNFHLNHNSFYKVFGKSIDIKNWDSVPVMTKKDLQQPLNLRLSDGYSKKNVYVNKTSGSSGDPFIFAKDKFCHSLTWAIIQDRFNWHGINFNTSKQARFYGIPLNKISYTKERIKDFLSNRYRFSVFDLSDTAFESVLKKFSESSFDYINGYTSSIFQFAKFLEKKNICLVNICPSLKVCVVTSEMLFEDDKTLMNTTFGVPIINEYGASELDLIAFQNKEMEWQINSESLYVEILDHNDNVLPLGSEGRIIITSLYNKAHPFIRYDIGDIGSLSEKSSVKKPVLKTLVGRTNDIIVLPSGKKAAGLTFYYITKRIIDNSGTVKEFTIEQQTLTQFTINYVSDSELNSDLKEKIRHEIKNYLEPGLDVVFNKLSKIDRTASGKLKQFSSLIT